MSVKQGPRKTTGKGGTKQVPQWKHVAAIVRDYRGSALKELLQNADDAGAKKFVFILSSRSYPSVSLDNEKLATFQGPALYAYNDAIFTDADITHIREIGNSSKQTDPAKTGKFGIGFNSCFQFTNVPFLVSGNSFVIFDIHGDIYSHNDGSVGNYWNFPTNNGDEDGDSLFYFEDFPDQLTPFHHFGCFSAIRSTGTFNGTMFRLPLRTKEQVDSGSSKVCDEIHDVAAIRSMLKGLEDEINQMLVFLKYLSVVEIYEEDESGNTTLLFSTSVTELEGVGNPQRSLWASYFEKVAISELDKVTEHPVWHFFLRFERHWHIEGREKQTPKVETWLVVRGIGGPEISKMAASKFIKGAKPWAAVALSLESEMLTNGRVFCSLPLPEVLEEIPYYVNAGFSISSNRREVSKEKSLGTHEYAWNKTLASEALPQLIKNAVEILSEDISRRPLLLRYWPRAISSSSSFWEEFLQKPTLKLLAGANIIPVQNKNSYNLYPFTKVLFYDEDRQPEFQMLLSLEGIAPVVPVSARLLSVLHTEFPDECTLLTPTSLTAYLIDRQQREHSSSFLPGVSAENKLWLLEYLLSEGSDDFLTELPLLQLVNGGFAKLGKGENHKCYLLREEISDLFCGSLSSFSVVDNEKLFLASIAASSVVRKESKRIPELIDNLNVLFKVVPPPKVSLGDFWGWLVPDLKSQHNQLVYSKLGKWPVIPTSGGILAMEASQNVLKSSAEFPPCVQGLLSFAYVADTDDSYELSCPLLPSEPTSLIKAINFRDLGSAKKYLSNLSIENLSDIRHYFLNKWVENTKTGVSLLPALKSLPLWPVNSKTGLSFLPSSVYLVHKELLHIHIYSKDFNLLYLSDDLERDRVIEFPGVENLSLCQYLKTIVLPDIEKRPQETVSDITEYILTHYEVLLVDRDSKALFNDLRGRRFVQGGDGALVTPAVLFHPDLAKKLKNWIPASKIPSSLYCSNPTYLRHLVSLGLKEELIQEDISNFINYLHGNHRSSAAYNKAVELLLYLQGSTIGLFFLVWEREKRWLPVFQDSEGYLVDLGYCPRNNGLVTPGEIVPYPLHPLVFTQTNLLPKDIQITEAFQKLMGWKCDTRLLEAHMKKLVQLSEKILSKRASEVTQILENIYSHLEEESIVTIKFTKISHLWLEGKFALLSHVSSQKHGYPPYLYSASSFHQKWPKLSRTLEIPEIFSPKQLANALREMHIASGDDGLSPDQVQLAISLLEEIAGREWEKDNLELYVVSEKGGKLLPIAGVVFNDQPRLTNHRPGDIPLLHPKISRECAERLNIKFLSDYFIEQNSDSHFYEDFSQKEPLTVRLRSITREYPLGLQFFEEQLQNSSDATAEEVNFVYDTTTYSNTNLFTPEMSKYQGPALYVHNSATFSDRDLESIKNLGNSYKSSSNTNTIGRFGIGFNVCYNITDMPSFVSGTHYVVFDPHCNSLPSKRPGIHWDFVAKNGALNLYEDQIAPFKGFFGCNMRDKFAGTIFRFPLRNREMAESSEIKDE